MDPAYTPHEYENERAANIYLMSLAVVIIGLPIPIINFIATGIVYLSNRKSTYFVRWHSLQALLSQLFIAIMNSVGFSWTMSIIFGPVHVTNPYIAYVITAALFNIAEFVSTIYAAIETRKGRHVDFWFFGPLTDSLCRRDA